MVHNLEVSLWIILRYSWLSSGDIFPLWGFGCASTSTTSFPLEGVGFVGLFITSFTLGGANLLMRNGCWYPLLLGRGYWYTFLLRESCCRWIWFHCEFWGEHITTQGYSPSSYYIDNFWPRELYGLSSHISSNFIILKHNFGILEWERP